MATISLIAGPVTGSTATSDISIAMTTIAGNNTAVFLCFVTRHTAGDVEAAPKWGGAGGTSMTLAVSNVNANNQSTRIYYLLNPSIGASTFYAGFADAATQKALWGGQLSNVLNIGPTNSAAAGGAHTEDTTTVAGVGIGSFIVDVEGHDADTVTTIGADQTSALNSVPTSDITFRGSYQTAVDGIMSWTYASETSTTSISAASFLAVRPGNQVVWWT